MISVYELTEHLPLNAKNKIRQNFPEKVVWDTAKPGDCIKRFLCFMYHLEPKEVSVRVTSKGTASGWIKIAISKNYLSKVACDQNIIEDTLEQLGVRFRTYYTDFGINDSYTNCVQWTSK